ncbi:MAG: EAL domain-containing protein [Novosphingobium sp.]|uniref:sensor domain-containing phosphodiesterase n=1 Tax=Novosphingobium sp. TaxID=1874826 RepID=UPI0032BCC58E
MDNTSPTPLQVVLQPPSGWAGDDGLTPIDRILDAVRSHLGMEIAFASRIHDGLREFTHIRADCPVPVAPGVAEPLEQTLCQAVLDGRLPALIHDASQHEAALPLPITKALPVGSHLNVPITLSDGQIYGTFCCVSRIPDLSLTERDMATLRAFAQLASQQIEGDLHQQRSRSSTTARIAAVIATDTLTILHQPIHELRSGRPVGVECLARFADAAERGPDRWFAEAAQVGLGQELELLAVRAALKTLPHVPSDCYVAVNVSPETVIGGALRELVSCASRDRLVIEVTEHDAVGDYSALGAELDWLRGYARIAVDDVGSGYAGLRHIVELKPDILKLDMSLTRQIDTDPARRALAHALVCFAREIGCKLVAEGIETEAERAALARLEVPLAQGYLFSRPMPVVAAQQLLLGEREPAPLARLTDPQTGQRHQRRA